MNAIAAVKAMKYLYEFRQALKRDDHNAIIRAWYRPNSDSPDVTFIDVWVRGIDGKGLSAGNPAKFTQRFRSTGNQLIDTTCGKRSFLVLETQ